MPSVASSTGQRDDRDRTVLHLEESDDDGDDDTDRQTACALLGDRARSEDSDLSGRFGAGRRRFSITSARTWVWSKFKFPHLPRDSWSDLKGRYGPTSAHSGLGHTVRTILFSSWTNLFLVFVPLAVASQLAHTLPIAIFALNALAIIPLTTLLTYATENVAQTLGVGMGAVLNTTFGNLVELIILIFMLQEGHLRLVLASLLGSIFVNLLFILGIAVAAGGLRNHEQLYSQRLTQMLVTFMNVGILSILIPTSLHATIRGNSKLADRSTLEFSRGMALCLLVVYGLYLHFMLQSRYYMYDESDSRSVSDNGESQRGTAYSGPSRLSTPSRAAAPSMEMQQMKNSAPSHSRAKNRSVNSLVSVAAARIPMPLPPTERDDEPEISRKASVVLLLVSAGVVSMCAEFLVDSIKHVVANARLTEAFLGLIILPLLGNTAELATAVTVAVKNKMDLAINVTIGSAIQITVFMAPAMVALGWMTGRDLSLHFNNFQIITLLATVAMVNDMMMNGRSHYLFGALLICVYVIIAIGAFVFPNQHGKTDLEGVES